MDGTTTPTSSSPKAKDGMRYFHMYTSNGQVSGRFTGRVPGTAAKKVAVRMYKAMSTKPTKFTVKIKECTRGRPKTVFTYDAIVKKKDKPVVRSINGTSFTNDFDIKISPASGSPLM
jgi:hypothetical protein